MLARPRPSWSPGMYVNPGRDAARASPTGAAPRAQAVRHRRHRAGDQQPTQRQHQAVGRPFPTEGVADDRYPREDEVGDAVVAPDAAGAQRLARKGPAVGGVLEECRRDQEGQRHRRQVDQGERREDHRAEERVGGMVDQSSQRGHLAAPARHRTVEQVRRHGQDEEPRRDPPLQPGDRPDAGRCAYEPHPAQRVRDGQPVLSGAHPAIVAEWRPPAASPADGPGRYHSQTSRLFARPMPRESLRSSTSPMSQAASKAATSSCSFSSRASNSSCTRLST